MKLAVAAILALAAGSVSAGTCYRSSREYCCERRGRRTCWPIRSEATYDGLVPDGSYTSDPHGADSYSDGSYAADSYGPVPDDSFDDDSFDDDSFDDDSYSANPYGDAQEYSTRSAAAGHLTRAQARARVEDCLSKLPRSSSDVDRMLCLRQNLNRNGM
ncbi:hypothetical protein HK105_202828 [Polyrhizophydium stewartii]|uniref:Uncharacterized protein n=1 Tax=Polyrhizophydium stewartii TaxID=2732419 RepID=A0ABR4NDE0_9FUNG